MELTLAQAASRLGVTTRQAQRLAHDGQLQVVRRVGRTVIVEDSAITQRRHVRAHRGRRWNTSTAWAAIEMLDKGSTDRISGSTRTRLKNKLSQICVEEFAHLATGRTQTRRMTQTRRRAEVLENTLMRTGRSALKHADTAAQFGLASGDSQIIEGYVHRCELSSILVRFGLEDDAEGEVFLHITDEDAVDSVITTALDLYERGTTREQSAAREVLQTVLDR